MRKLLIATASVMALTSGVAMAQVGASSGGGGGGASSSPSSNSTETDMQRQASPESGRSSGVMGSGGTHANQNGGIDDGVGITLSRPSTSATTIIGGGTGPGSQQGNGSGSGPRD